MHGILSPVSLSSFKVSRQCIDVWIPVGFGCMCKAVLSRGNALVLVDGCREPFVRSESVLVGRGFFAP